MEEKKMQKSSEDLKLNIDEMDVVSGGVMSYEEWIKRYANCELEDIPCRFCGAKMEHYMGGTCQLARCTGCGKIEAV